MIKKSFIFFACLFTGTQLFSQGKALVKKENLQSVQFVSEITPMLWPKMWLPVEQRSALDQLSRMAYSGSFIYSNKYNTVVDYVSVEIIASSLGKTLTARGGGDVLTTEQKNVLSMADAGSDLTIKLKFKFKPGKNNESFLTKEIVEGFLTLTVVPEKEAEFPGGYWEVKEYLKKEIKQKTSQGNIKNVRVKFTVNEKGETEKAKIEKSSGNLKTDKLLLEAITNMPKWKPAKNSKGIAVKQEFHVMLGTQPVDGC